MCERLTIVAVAAACILTALELSKELQAVGGQTLLELALLLGIVLVVAATVALLFVDTDSEPG